MSDLHLKVEGDVQNGAGSMDGETINTDNPSDKPTLNAEVEAEVQTNGHTEPQDTSRQSDENVRNESASGVHGAIPKVLKKKNQDIRDPEEILRVANESKAALDMGDVQLAKSKAIQTYQLAQKAMEHYALYGRLYTREMLVQWFRMSGTTFMALGEAMLAIRCFYTVRIYDDNCNKLNLLFVTEAVWQQFWSILPSMSKQDIFQLLKDLIRLRNLAEQQGAWNNCFEISVELNTVCSILNDNTRFKESVFLKTSRQDCLLLAARSALKLGKHDDVRKNCTEYLQQLCDYDNSEVLGIWAKSLWQTGKLETALGKARAALRNAKAEEDKARLQGIIADIESKVKATDTVSTRYPDEDWLGDTKLNKVKRTPVKVQKSKKRHKRPKAKENVSPTVHPSAERPFTETNHVEDATCLHGQNVLIRSEYRHTPAPDSVENNEPHQECSKHRVLYERDGGSVSNNTNHPLSFTPRPTYQIFPSDSEGSEDGNNETGSQSSSWDDHEHEDDEDTEDETDEATATDDVTFYETSLRALSGNSETENEEVADKDLLQNGVTLNKRYLSRFQDRHSRVSARLPFYEELQSKQQCLNLLNTQPKVYKRCMFHLESAHTSRGSPIDSVDRLSRIEISGRSKAGQTFNEDEVVVELLDNESSNKTPNKKPQTPEGKDSTNNTRYGKVVGFLERHRCKNIDNPVFICTLDERESHLVRPMCKTLPKIHILNTEIMKTCPKSKRFKVEVYDYSSKTEELVFREIKNIDPSQRDRYVFLVAYINWSRWHIYPRGAVVRIIPCGTNFQAGLRILDLQCAVPTQYAIKTVKHMESISIRHKESGPSREMEKGRTDLTNLRVFTIDPQGSTDLDDALSVEEEENDVYKVGVHISDVAAWVNKDDPIDQEAKERAMTFYPGIRRPRHMLPEPFSENYLSLLPARRRLAITLFFYVDKEGKPKGNEVCLVKSVVKSVKKLTYSEAQHIIEDERAGEDPTHSRVKVLFMLAKQMRIRRLGKSMFAMKLDESLNNTREAHYLVEEFMILANKTVAKVLLSKYATRVPLRCQPPPCAEHVQAWLNSHGSIVDSLLSLQGRQITDYKKPDLECAASTGGDKKVMIQKRIFRMIKQNTREGMQLVKTDVVHPLQFLAYHEWLAIQEPAKYRCSGQLSEPKKDGRHFSLEMFPYTHFTSPIRRYIDLVVQRLLNAFLDKKSQQCPYTVQDVAAICLHSNSVLCRSKLYQKSCKALIFAIELKENPRSFNVILEDVSEQGITFVSPEVRSVPRLSREIPFSLMDVDSRPKLLEDPLTNRQKVSTTWRKRIYDTRGYHTNAALSGHHEKNINPHQDVIVIGLTDWVAVVKHAIDGNIDGLRELLATIPQYNLSDRTVDDISTELYHFPNPNDAQMMQPNSKFSMTFGCGQVVKIQLSAELQKGILTVKPQMIDMLPSMKCCLQHTEDPVRYLSVYSKTSTCDSYQSCREYIRIWKPLTEMEAAVDAVRNEEKCIITNVAIRFTSTGGKFIMFDSFFEERGIQFGGLGHERLEEDNVEDSNTENVHDWLCIKHELTTSASSDGQGDRRIWHAHADITKVRKRTDEDNDSDLRIVVYFTMRPQSTPVPTAIGNTLTCNLELIVRSDTDRRVEQHIKEIDSASSLAKQIALNKRISELDEDHRRLAETGRFDVRIKYSKKFMEGSKRPFPRNNVKQTQAIRNSLMNRFSLIQGPPGTGKSYTGIKLMVLFNMINKKWADEGNPRKKIMFCGPSNRSVDVVAGLMIKRLEEACPDILRVYGRSIEDRDYPVPGRIFLSGKSVRNSKSDPELENITLHHIIRRFGKPHADKIKAFDKKFKDPNYVPDQNDAKRYKLIVRKASVEELKAHDIILCTTAVGTNPKVIKATGKSIFQLIIDEAGMCPEPNCIAPIIATKAEQVVLIGDHKQLRPIILCKQAAELGLDRSLFERYADTSRHNRHTVFTMLDTQYRMNPNLCEFPSNQFYGGNLRTELEKLGMIWQDAPDLSLWPCHHDVQIPRLFCHVEGQENVLTVATEEGNEQSKSNETEARLVVEIYNYLVKKEKIKGTDINIMSQYNAQCFLLRESLKRVGYTEPIVNTVVASQGGEWNYVIFSTVRSLPDYKIEKNPTLGWCVQNLGFITDENQTNVALTRARMGLIIVGNKNLLRCDEVWRKLINNYEETGCMRTKNFRPRHPRPVYRRYEDQDGWQHRERV